MVEEPRALILDIQRNVQAKSYRLTSHAEREREADQITVREIEEALLSRRCEVIENYPDDPRGASCLVLGFTEEGLPLHLVCGVSLPDVMVIVTVYRQHPDKWFDWRIRKGSVE
jgi:hypothetical protein